MIASILVNHKEIYTTFSKIGKSFPNKKLIEHDKNNVFDVNLWKHFSKHKITGLLVDEKNGGKNFSCLKTALAFEALASSCQNNGLLFSAAAHLLAGVGPLNFHGSEIQKQNYLSKLASGKWMACNAITEKNAGSDVFNMNSTAVKKGDKYILNGEKIYVTNSPLADLFLVYVLTDKTKGFFGGVSCFLIKKNTKGLSISPIKEKMGLRTAQMATVKLKNVEANKNDLLGKEGAGAQIFMQSMQWERVGMSAFLTGQLIRVLNNTIVFCKTRKVGDKKLFDLQNIQHLLADAKTIINASQNLVYDAGFAIDSKSKEAMTKSSIAKLFVSENVVNTLKNLQTVYGAAGFLTENNIEREYRDAYASLLYSGTSAIQKNIIALSL